MAEKKTDTEVAKAIDALGRYFNIRSKSAFVNLLIELKDSSATDEDTTMEQQLAALAKKPPEHKIGELFLQATEGSLSTMELLDKLSEELGGEHASKLIEMLSVTFEPSALAAKGCDKVARPIPIKWADESAAGHCGGSFREKPDLSFLDPEMAWDAGAMNTDHYAPNTASIRNLFWSDELIAAMVEKDPDAINKYDLQGRNADRDDMANGLGINSESHLDNPTPQTPVVTVFDIKDSHLSPATRDSSAVAVFMNFVPTVEMSRCQPYLDIQIISKRPPTTGENEKVDTVSLSQFLMGNVELKTLDPSGESADYIITKSTNASLLSSGMYRDDPDSEDKDESQIATAGMELFTSPQMMIDADNMDFTLPDSTHAASANDPGGIGSSRAARVLDKFRPLATLQSFTVEVTPSGGMMSHKTAKIQITLHDRSRLAEMGEFIKPDLYGSTELLVEYGWMHPDGLHLATDDTDNPFATLLNSMRVKEKYKIINSDFSFDEVGQVEIGVELSMMGLISFDTSDISKGPGVSQKLNEINRLFDTVRRLRRAMRPQGESGSSNATGETWLNSVTSMSGIGGLDNETRTAMNTWRTQNRAGADGVSPSASDLATALDGLLGEPGDPESGALHELDQTIDAALGWKKEHLKSSHSGDPWWRPIHPDQHNFCKVRINCCDPRIDAHLSRDDKSANGNRLPYAFRNYPQFVSLGKVLMTYVAGPLAMDEKFDEIQWFFYPINKDASFMRNRQISEFPINVEKFDAELQKLTEQTAFVPLRRFLGMLQRKFLGSLDNEAWGLADLYTTNDEGNRELHKDYTEGSPTALHDAKNKRLAYAYHSDITMTESSMKFKKPRIGIHTECVPAMNSDESGVSGKVRTILKIHVYDKAQSSYSSVQDLLTAARNDTMGQISTALRENQSTEPVPAADRSAAHKQVIELATEQELLVAVTGDGNASEGRQPSMFRINGGFPRIKNFIRSVMPSIIYGSSTSAVLNASLSSQNDPQMATIMMMRSGHGDARSPTGTRDAGLPLKVAPTSLDLEIIGCPLVGFGQQFFIDFGTGTNVDNVYAITGISHALVQGEFKTSLKMTQLDAYGAYESTLNLATQSLRSISENP